MNSKIIMVIATILLITMAGCAVRFSAEVKNPWHPEVTHDSNGNKINHSSQTK